jgi:putative membrane protein
MRFLVRLLINAAALWVAARLIPQISYYGDWVSLVLVALVFGVLNAFVRPILQLVTCPLQILTLGLFTLVVNAIMLLLTSAVSGVLGLHFRVENFWGALLGALVVSIVSIILSVLVKDEGRRSRK